MVMNKKRQRVTGVGGTFDHFHAGHRHFLDFAEKLGQELLIGITDLKLTQHKFMAELIQPFAVRKQTVDKYCRAQGYQYKLAKLKDPYGPTLENSPVTGLCVSPETTLGARKINDLRSKLKLRELETFVCPWYQDGTGAPLSSSNIRAGKVDRQGRVYAQLFNSNLVLSDKHRQFFAQPQGDRVDMSLPKLDQLIAVVGDSSLEKFISFNWPFDLGIYDKKVMRQANHSPVINRLKPDLTLANPAGQITSQLVAGLITALTSHFKYLYVKGEEDLAAVALMLLLPLGSQIYYGQPNQGLIVMEVTVKRKELFFFRLSQ